MANPSEIIAAQQAELDLLRENKMELTRRSNEIATEMTRLVVEAAAVSGPVRQTEAFASCCELLGYSSFKLMVSIEREVNYQPPEDRLDTIAQILKEVLEGTYLQEDSDDEEHASDSQGG